MFEEYELTTTEKNALKWVTFREYYRNLSDTYLDAQDRYFKIEGFLKAIGVNDD